MFKKKVGEKVADEEQNLLVLMETSVNKFKNTIQELTEITKINKGINEDVQLVFFSEVLRDVKEDLLTSIQETDAQIITEFKVVDIYFSKVNFKSVLHNLISNALKYRSPERAPVVEVKTFIEGDFCVLSVKDNGLGFDVSKKDKVFSMFRRLHTHVEGTGLGLYIVKRIIEDAGGKIDVDSTLGVGSEFRVYFPA